jgi:predicted nucleic acid-binding protein
MTFADLVTGEAIFIDANTLVYHFAPDPLYGRACAQLVERIENQEIQGFTSTHILTEVAHRLMTIEASTVFGWPFAGIAVRLRKHPAEIQRPSKRS